MFVLVAGRREGKTTKLINWWAQDPEHHKIVVMTQQRASYVLRQLKAQHPDMPAEFTRKAVIVYKPETMRGLAGHYRYGVDDVDGMLQLMMNGAVDIITMTGVEF